MSQQEEILMSLLAVLLGITLMINTGGLIRKIVQWLCASSKSTSQNDKSFERLELPAGCKSGWFVSREERILRYDWKKKVSWVRLAKEIMWFTNSELNDKGIKYFPTITLRYYAHKKVSGVYYSRQKEIIIYVNNHEKLKHFVDTVLHETCHHIQNSNQEKQFNKLYDEYTSEFGYNDNPFEVESRKFARERTADCLEYLYRKNIIS